MKDGAYGSPPRQRSRCVGPVVNEKTGEVRRFHRFTPPLPRLMSPAGVCDVCDSALHAHTGPASSRTYAFPVREVAAAFVAVGTGASYARAADRARVAVGRLQLGGEQGGALVAEWLDLLAPVVLDAHAERAWPETLVLDNTWFMVENHRTHRQTLAFHVLGAYGYPAGARRGRVWALHASHQATQADWEAFLRTLDVSEPPKLVITDGNAAIGNAVRAVRRATAPAHRQGHRRGSVHRPRSTGRCLAAPLTAVRAFVRLGPPEESQWWPGAWSAVVGVVLQSVEAPVLDE
jgi:hypothetical protein